MKLYRQWPMLVWAMRDVMRSLGEHVLLAVALSVTSATMAVALLLPQALADTAAVAIKDGPSLVIRKVGTAGFTPVPIEDIESIKKVMGVTSAYPRLWGLATGPNSAVTVRALLPNDENSLSIKDGFAFVGPGLGLQAQEKFTLKAATQLSLTVLPTPHADSFAQLHDTVLVSPSDARRLLGIPKGYATDIGVKVFHEGEQEAIIPDLVDALAWPANITTQTKAIGRYRAAIGRRGSLSLIAMISVLLALALLVVATVRQQRNRQAQVALFKALGWTTGDVLRLSIYRALIVGFPSVILGMCMAYVLVFFPGIQWPTTLFFGWDTLPPALTLSNTGAMLVLLEVFSLVFLPFFAATLWPAIRSAVVDPGDWLAGGGV